MPLLTNNQATAVKGGTYIAVATVTTGVIALELSYDKSSWTPITDASWSSTATAAITLPKCFVRPVPTGSSQLDLTIIERKR